MGQQNAGVNQTVPVQGDATFSDTVFMRENVLVSGNVTFGGILAGNAPMRFTAGTDQTTTLEIEDPSQDTVIIFPDESGSILTTSSSAQFDTLIIQPVIGHASGELKMLGQVNLGGGAENELTLITLPIWTRSP